MTDESGTAALPTGKHEFERVIVSHAPPPAFIRMKDVLRLTSLSRPTLYRRIAAGRFPPPVHLGGRACAWTPKSLQLWINDPQGYRTTLVVEPDIRLRPGRPRKY
ncbi:MAG: AlpA family phage regulatory protein [Steroidobacteraceae bacterium]